MNNNKMMQQISSVFSLFMVAFYLGTGTYLIFFISPNFNIDEATRVIIGSAFLIYGTFRAFRAFFQIKDIFFNTESEDE